MNIKRFISVSLLILVLFSIVFLLYKEFGQRHSEKPSGIAETQIADTSQKSQSPNKDTTTRKDLVASTQKTDPAKTILKGDKKSFAKSPPVAKGTEEKSTSPQPAQQVLKSKVVAYYFHGTRRCATCLTIERYSREAVEQYFAKDIQEGRLEFRSLNTDEPENRHYIEDYQIAFQSLILTLLKDDIQTKWKNLPEVWLRVRDKEKFFEYVKDEVEKFLREEG